MSTSPRVTIGLPVYNGERYIGETLDSLLAQDFGDYEVLVSDNASTDGTWDVVASRAGADPRVRIIRSDHNMGAAHNYNRLVYEAHGELFKWAGYDDLLDPRYVSRCVEALDASPDAVLAFPGTVIIDEHGTQVREYDDRLDLRDGAAWRRVARFARRVNLCNACFGVMRRDVMLSTGLIRPYVSSDIPFLAEMAARGLVVQLPDRLFYRRVHGGSSRQGHHTMAEVARWFDPAARRGPRAPRLRLFAGTVGALAVTPGSLIDRTLITTAYAGVYSYRRLRIRAGRTRDVLTGRQPGRSELIHQLEGSDS